ncbi:thioredoxin family protein [Chitinophaga sp. MM2321]|uniref:thioredoxin family protein n=1 Tax=Chitinophaga sp. MM2321 TaxID=3137178 RepID=UPI0032D598FE
MKGTVLIFCLLLSVVNALSAQETAGIRFSDMNYEAALKAAKESGKLVFIDVYTTWCPPCKRMEKEIFPLAEVGNTYNKSFINCRINAEDKEGSVVARKYNVGGYPTYLFLNEEGEVLHRGLGYNPDPAVFLRLAKVAADNAKRNWTVESMQKKYAQKKNDPDFLITYIRKLEELHMDKDVQAPLDQYLSLIRDDAAFTSFNINFLLQHIKSIPSNTVDFIIAHQDDFVAGILPDELYPEKISRTKEEKYGSVMNNVIMGSMVTAISQKDKALFELIHDKARQVKHLGGKFQLSFFGFSTQFSVTTKDTTGLIKQLHAFADTTLPSEMKNLSQYSQRFYDHWYYPYLIGKEDSTKIKDFVAEKESWKGNYQRYLAKTVDNAARRYLEFGTSRDDFQQGITLGKTAAELNKEIPDAFNTMALLYYKTHRQKKALKYQRQAVSLSNQQQRAVMEQQLNNMKLRKAIDE